MTRHRTLLLAILAGLTLATGAAQAESATTAARTHQAYDEQADANATLKAALTLAGSTHRSVLVIFGANWCPDCRALAHMMGRGKLAARINEHYIVVKVDIGNWDKNLELATQLGYPIQKGIPAASVVAADGTVLAATQAGELTAARRLGEDGVFGLFERLPTRPATAP